MARHRSPWPLRAAGVFSLSAIAVAALASSGRADTLGAGGFSNGTAAATAYGVKVNPTAAQLSIGVAFGTSLAGYTNEVAKAESRAIDLGVIGTTLAGQGCDGSPPSWPAEDQPQPLDADSRDADSAGGRSGPEVIQGQAVPGFLKVVKATDTPFSEASTTVAPISSAGVIEISGAKSDSVTRVINKQTREAVATTDIDSISLFGDIVRLGGMHWQVVQHSGADTAVVTNFALATMSINKTPVPIPSSDPSAAFTAANQALASLGIQLRPPTVRKSATGASIDPVVIAVVPSPSRDALAGALLGQAQPVRQQITDFMLNPPFGSCKNGTYITIADIATGSITGSGSFSIELGGVSASSKEVKLGHFLLDLPAFNPGNDLSGGSVDFTPASSLPADLGGAPVVEGTTVNTAGRVRTGGASSTAGARRIASTHGARGGRLAGIAAGTLALLMAVAEADRRKMRSAQRMIPVEG